MKTATIYFANTVNELVARKYISYFTICRNTSLVQLIYIAKITHLLMAKSIFIKNKLLFLILIYLY